ncbi:indolethylamine N-methyltransferase [Ixodes scapularis]
MLRRLLDSCGTARRLPRNNNVEYGYEYDRLERRAKSYRGRHEIWKSPSERVFPCDKELQFQHVGMHRISNPEGYLQKKLFGADVCGDVRSSRRGGDYIPTRRTSQHFYISDIKQGALEIQKRTRSSIRKVIPCDVLEPGVLPEEHRETFDVVLSCNCLESATTDHECFQSAVCNVGTLAKPGGLLVLMGVGGPKSYPAGTADFNQAYVTEDVIKRAVTDAGFQMGLYRTKNIQVDSEIPDMFTFVLAARQH